MKKWLLMIGFVFVLVLAACGSDSTSSNEEGEDSSSEGSSEEVNNEDAASETSGKLAELQEKGTVTVGFANEKPYAYEENGELKGAAVDIAKAVFAELGIENMESKLADFSQLIPGLQAGQFDVITAGMAILPERCENALFAEPEMKYGEGLIVPAGNPLGLESYKDIAANTDVTVVVMEGTTEIGFLEEEGVDPSQITTAPDIPATFSAVQSGRADVTTGTEMTVKMALESLGTDDLEFVENFEQPDVDGVPSYGAAAFNLNDEDLRDAYNEVLEKLKEDGTVAELLEKNSFSGTSNMVEVGEVTAEQACNGEV